MAAAANGRLLKELKEVGKNDTSGVHAKPVTEGNLRHLKGTVKGPEGTVYDGGVFEIDITLPPAYPFEPPKMKFLTKIWHPNISSQTGAICLVSQEKLRQAQMKPNPQHVLIDSLLTFLLHYCEFGFTGYPKRPMEPGLNYQNSFVILAGTHVFG